MKYQVKATVRVRDALNKRMDTPLAVGRVVDESDIHPDSLKGALDAGCLEPLVADITSDEDESEGAPTNPLREAYHPLPGNAENAAPYEGPMIVNDGFNATDLARLSDTALLVLVGENKHTNQNTVDVLAGMEDPKESAISFLCADHGPQAEFVAKADELAVEASPDASVELNKPGAADIAFPKDNLGKTAAESAE